eukprot:CAMPEP_0119551124 /NCGR_PEP_ID=MMETSP1352-20130426/4471_1 /TAXON_ID=265584 /ORGANISM="Stauroneis constricta, Strain CCMP1120" /LENGTH=694 /DNA_ID=CAMNT_0007597133 /DNA_START=13 /DNA_END=2094 /DNA_ORIENTATION=-
MTMTATTRKGAMMLAMFVIATTMTTTSAFQPMHKRASLIPLASSSSKTSGNEHKEATFRAADDGDEWIEDSFNEDAAALDAKIGDHPLASKGEGAFVGPTNVLIYDTTLRDGTQGESVSASCEDKLKIAARLAEFGVDYIEAGWPGSNPKDAEFFARAPTELSPTVQSKLVAFGSTRRKNIQAKDDKQLQALLDANVPTICLVAKSHAWQVTDILRCALDENLKMISDSVSYLVQQHDKTVLVDLEHFFDGYKESPDYALLCCEAAVEAGASSLVLCDTNGGSMPWEVAEISKTIVAHFQDATNPVTIGIHTHNDCGMAVANSLQGCHSGVGLVQGTINGIGERTGNADLCSIIPSLALHVNSKITCRDHLSKLTQLSRWLDETLNRTPNQAAPYVGASAFAHKGGLHVAAMERSSKSYQHIEPEDVGNEKRVLISELSGRQNILGMLKTIFNTENESSAISDIEQSDRAVAILQRVKELEHQGYTFEGAEASVHLMILHASKGYCPPFSVLDYSAQVYDQSLDSASRVLAAQQRALELQGNDGSKAGEKSVSSESSSSSSSSTSRATVKVRTVAFDNDDDTDLYYRDTLEVSDGSGPVDALANALMRALVPTYPQLKDVELVDYKVRILDPTAATGAATRVMIEFRLGKTTSWTTVSVDRNVISASLNALVDGLEYALVEHTSCCMLCDDAYD